MFDHEDENPSGGYWPSVTDLFITLFIIAIVMLGAVFFILLPKNNIAALEQVQIAVGTDFVKVLEPTNRLRKELDLPPITYKNSKQVIADLTATCDAAVDRLQVLKRNDPTGMSSEIDLLKDRIKDLEAMIRKLEEELRKARGPEDVAELLRRMEQLEQENEELKRDNTTIVINEERSEFRFDSGSPVIKPKFSNALRTRDPNDKIDGNEPPFPRIAAEIIKRRERVDTLEVIGHTDGVPLSTTGNLDQRLPDLLAGELGGSRHLSAGSNNDLGLLRALALKQEWLAYVDTYEPIIDRAVLRRINLRCYSAGQSILPVPEAKPTPDSFRREDPRARRIEMRLTRLGRVSDGSEGTDSEKAESGNEP